MIFTPRNILLSSLFLLLGLLLLLPILPRQNFVFRPVPYAALINSFEPLVERDQSKDFPAPEPVLTAKAGIIYNPLDQNILFQKNIHVPYGIASLTKIMTALVALERVGMQDILPVSSEAILTEGNEGNLVSGEHLTLKNLITIMMTESSNDAAVVIAEHVGRLHGTGTFEESQLVFVRLMNEKASQLGLTSTYFENPTGLDIDEEAGVISNTSSAFDIAHLATYTLRYPSIWEANNTSVTLFSEEGIEHSLSTTHDLILREAGVLSGKTGFTDTVGGTLVTITETPVGNLSVIVILGSTRSERFTNTENLISWLRTL